MKNPKVTILMSVYNGEKFLKETLESILSQTFSNFEFIIIDDASTDKTASILKEYTKKDNRIRIIKNKKNIGLTRSLNKGIKSSQGKYIARIDAGDIALPVRIEKQIKFMKDNKEIGLLGTNYFEVNKKGKIIREISLPTNNKNIKKELIKKNPFAHPTVLIRKLVLNKTGLYDEKLKLSQDYELWFRISQVSNLANLPEPLTKVRKTKKSLSFQKRKEQAKTGIEIRKKILREGNYPFWCWIYVLKKYILSKIPKFLSH